MTESEYLEMRELVTLINAEKLIRDCPSLTLKKHEIIRLLAEAQTDVIKRIEIRKAGGC